MKKLILSFAILLLPMASQATRVGVTDSGTDFSHVWLQGHALINEKEIAGNLVDDDHNGKVDDIMGWNFVEDYGKIFFPEHLQSVDPSTFNFFEVIARKQAGTSTKEDVAFWDQHVTKLSKDQKVSLMAKLNFYGEYAHSTHVSGIIASLSPLSKIESNRVFPDTPPEQDDSTGATAFTFSTGSTKTSFVNMIYKILAVVNNGSFVKVAAYLNELHIDVANYSLGVGLANVAKVSLGVQGNKNPTPEQIATETRRIGLQFNSQGEAWMKSSPGTLFCVAAGNDGTDNDILPAFPSNVRVENQISVAASQDWDSLASFSNYGKTMVDIAAPGVAILSSVPSLDHKLLLHMSGTSMATPYIVGIAASLKEINPALKPAELKALLMGTVDHKDWLVGKVVSEGVVNPARAQAAAALSKSMSIDAAVARARSGVPDHAVSAPKSSESILRAHRAAKEIPELQSFADALVF